MDVFVARQPIFDRAEQLAGYELLYRNTAASTTASGAAAETMCTDTVIHAFLDIGLGQLTDGARAFINCTRDFLLDGQVDLLPAESVVVELLETVGFDEPVIDACRRLKYKGYTLALDDYVDTPLAAPMLELASIVKLDVLHADVDALRLLAARLKTYHLQLLAERVETQAMHDQCVDIGFSYFQGYLYSRPELVVRQEIAVGVGAMVRLLNLLLDPGATDSDVDDGFRSDPALTYKLLRIVNSAAVGGRGVESIPFAIRMVGRQMLYRWLALLMVSSMTTGSGMQDHRVYATLLRARLCELIAESIPGSGFPQALFMVGLFSRLDAVLGMSPEELMARVHVSDDIRQAVLSHTGPYAAALEIAEYYERGDWERVETLTQDVGLLPTQLPWMYTKALTWVNLQLDAMREP